MTVTNRFNSQYQKARIFEIQSTGRKTRPYNKGIASITRAHRKVCKEILARIQKLSEPAFQWDFNSNQ